MSHRHRSFREGRSRGHQSEIRRQGRGGSEMEGQARTRGAAGNSGDAPCLGRGLLRQRKTTFFAICRWPACRPACTADRNSSEPGGTVHNVRLKRAPDDEKKIGIWQWRAQPVYRHARIERIARADGGDQQLGPEGCQQRHLPASDRTGFTWSATSGASFGIAPDRTWPPANGQRQSGILSANPNSSAG